MLKHILSLGALACLLAGCQTGKVSTIDRITSNIVTQDIPVVHSFTNTFAVTNIVPYTSYVPYMVEKPVYVTQMLAGASTILTQLVDQAAIKEVIGQTVTTAMSNSVMSITSSIPVPQLTANQTKDTLVSTGAGMAGNMVGLGAVAAVLGLGILHGYQQVRNKQLLAAASGESATKDAIIASALQGIETIRQVIQTTPQGAQIDAAVKSFLVNHQTEAGVIQQVAGLVQTQVDNPAAKQAAQLILDEANKMSQPAANTAGTVASTSTGAVSAPSAKTA